MSNDPHYPCDCDDHADRVAVGVATAPSCCLCRAAAMATIITESVTGGAVWIESCWPCCREMDRYRKSGRD